jgi:hypothetical protein
MMELRNLFILGAKQMSKKLKITIEFEDENGNLITRPVSVERDIPWLKEFDNLGFRESFHMLETAVLEGRKEASNQAIEQFLEKVSKKNEKIKEKTKRKNSKNPNTLSD